jgi:peptidoglycan/LPS O-acetylase OafA/YrhL
MGSSEDTKPRRRRRRAKGAQQRLDIQGLRMVSMVTVFAYHLWGWPRGGVAAIDVFFVISGFLITGNLMRSAEKTGTVSFKQFYWNRIRRIVPAATVVLVLTYLASTLVFLPFRSHEVGVDAWWAFIFWSNWHFLSIGTDYFHSVAATVSPIQHYWTLSVEEQFYFVWPAVILAVSVIIVHKSWTHSRRMALAGGVMGVIVLASLFWAMRETTQSPMAAYFDTFARVWELGFGALLATAVGLLARIPRVLKPILSWGGLLVIGISFALISDSDVRFPAPWTMLPVLGAGLVVAAGVGREPDYQPFLRNRVSTYIGNISYSLYLVHWPVIVLLGAVMSVSGSYYVAVVALAFGLAIASYHLIENPLRRANFADFGEFVRTMQKRKYVPVRSTQYAALAAAVLVVIAGTAWLARPPATVEVSDAEMDLTREKVDSALPPTTLGPRTAALQDEITEALQASSWPVLNPTMESLFQAGEIGEIVTPETAKCSMSAVAPPEFCTYGPSNAPLKVVLVGDSVGLGYSEIWRQLALSSNGALQVFNQAMGSCVFTQDDIDRATVSPECSGRKDSAVDVINNVKPDAVIIANAYTRDRTVGTKHEMSIQDWSDSLNRIIDRFKANTKKVVLVAPPPSDKAIKECVSKVSSTPASCVGTVPPVWYAKAKAEQKLAEALGGGWVDSRPWFCNQNQRCPSFVGTTPARVDWAHMAPPYAGKMAPAYAESLTAAGVPLADNQS